MEKIQTEEEIKEIFILDRNKECSESEAQIKAIMEYLANDHYHKVWAMIPGGFTWYTDGIYYWREDAARIVEKRECGLADGFIDHVLRRLKEDGEG